MPRARPALDEPLDQSHSPFQAVGIYISGNSRACREQANLTPQWISAQLAKGWRLLPITLGPQASCQPRFPRYNDDPKINPKRGTDGVYLSARNQGTAEATKTVGVAQSLGIVAGSTMWYDLEGFNDNLKDCRESALAFLSAWTDQIHACSATSRASTPAPGRASRCSTTPASSGPASSASPIRSGSPAGTATPTRRPPTSATTAGCRAAG